MKLVRDNPGNRNYIRAADGDSITVGEEVYSGPLVITPDEVDTGWNVATFDELSEESLRALLRHDPEVVIVGTGEKQEFPAAELLGMFYQAGVGIEFMNTQAACRTFNILVVEERKVVAGLIPG